jgi:hypothetical protein
MGACVQQTPPVDADDEDPCTADSCDPLTGAVTNTPVPSGTSCSDGEVCNGEETCQGGGSCATVPSGGVSWWRAEGDANDSIDVHHGTMQPAVNGATFAAGQVGQAFSFDGSNDYVSLNPHAAALELTTGTATLEFWMNSMFGTCQTIFSLRQNSFAGPPIVPVNEQFFQFGNCDGNAGTNDTLTWRHVVGGAVPAVVTTATYTGATPGGGLINTGWHHVAITLDGSNTVIYVDGSAVSVSSMGPNPGDWGGFALTPTLATIGARDLGTSRSAVFRGQLDEVTLYDRALSAAEISSIHMAGAAGKCTGAGGGGVTCTDGPDAPAGTMCEAGGMCDGAGNCQ